MRTLCDVCEGAAAIFFCAADEAALCQACDEKVHMCNKLASRHIRVGLAAPNAVPKCDICENAPAFFYCDVDGSSLCLQCDMVVHVGGKRTHRRYLLLRQRAEFPGDKYVHAEEMSSQQANQVEGRKEQNQSPNGFTKEKDQPHHALFVDGDTVPDAKKDNKMIDLNARPQRTVQQSPNNQAQDMEDVTGANGDSTSVVPVRSFKSEPEK